MQKLYTAKKYSKLEYKLKDQKQPCGLHSGKL